MDKETLRAELVKFTGTLLNGYTGDSTILELLGTTDCIDDYVDNQLRARWENKPSEKKVQPLNSVTPRYFYVVERNNNEGLDQISIGLESLPSAKKFKDSAYHKKTYPNSFLICTFNEG